MIAQMELVRTANRLHHYNMKKKENKSFNVKSIDLMIYPITLHITDCEPDKINELFNGKEGTLSIPDKDRIFARIYNGTSPIDDKNAGITMWVNNDLKLYPDEIAHEVCHIVDYVYDFVSEYEITMGSEANAYFFQYIYRIIYEELDKIGRLHGK